jgi:hypothetical protein
MLKAKYDSRWQCTISDVHMVRREEPSGICQGGCLVVLRAHVALG